MGGRGDISQATQKEIIETSKIEASKAVKDFDNKWHRAARK